MFIAVYRNYTFIDICNPVTYTLFSKIQAMNIKLTEKLSRLKSVLNTDKYLTETNNGKVVQNYYRTNRIAYRLFHNRQGFLHMGISHNGHYSDADLLEPLKQIGEYIQNKDGFKVLELASGQGANTTYLAEQYTNVDFTALDYSTKPKNEFYKLNNTKFDFGDYHDLSKFSNASFDLVFIIEALCHANDVGKVIAEVSKVLKPYGYFIIFDGYYGKNPTELDEAEKEVSKLTATGMAVKDFQYLPHFQTLIKDNDFNVIEETNLSRNVLPTMKRFERLAKAFIKLGVVGRLLTKILPDMFVRNAISGYLMPELMEQGIAVYYKHVLQKK